jgi:hypothetical protein
MLIYDAEIIKAIPYRDQKPKPGIAYCKGWEDYEGMGVSVVGAYDYEEHRYRVFCRDNMNEFVELAKKRSPLVGFNNIRFDNNLLGANGIRLKASATCTDWDPFYDLLQEIWIGAGLPLIWNSLTHAGYGLDAVCTANFGQGKSGNGALAPVLWQQGKIGEVIDYCLEDVRLTKTLLDRVIECGWIINPKTGKRINIQRPR